MSYKTWKDDVLSRPGAKERVDAHYKKICEEQSVTDLQKYLLGLHELSEILASALWHQLENDNLACQGDDCETPTECCGGKGCLAVPALLMAAAAGVHPKDTKEIS